MTVGELGSLATPPGKDQCRLLRTDRSPLLTCPDFISALFFRRFFRDYPNYVLAVSIILLRALVLLIGLCTISPVLPLFSSLIY
jgi:hypothetical protein